VTADEPGETADGAGVTAAAPAGRVGHLHHQPALDGVRGLAVLAVVVLHAGPASWLPGGFLGVSLFFTLSGYLIASLVIIEVEGAAGSPWLGSGPGGCVACSPPSSSPCSGWWC
jgi:hypothetical protein